MRRLRDIGDARLDIDDARLAPDTASAGERTGLRRERIAWMGVVAFAALAGLGAARWAMRVEAPAEMRLDVTMAETTSLASFAISPDGSRLVFSVQGPRGSQLWIRSLDSSTPRPLAGTDDGLYPFWSPDGRSIGFFTPSALKRVDIDGGPAQTLATAVTPAGGSWNADGTILYVPNDASGVFRVPATGGESTRVTPPPPASLATRFPQLLPGGRHFLFYVAREDESAGIYLGDLASGAIRRLLGADTPAVFGSGHLWFANDGTLFAQRFDPSTQQLEGAMLRVAEDVGAESPLAVVSASATGPIAYRSGPRDRRALPRLTWFDRTGRRLSVVADSEGVLSQPSLSPDGRQLLVQQTVRQNVDVWLLDLDREVFTRLTVDPVVNSMPVWSPDGIRFVLNTPGEGGRPTVGIKHVDGSRPDEELVPNFPNVRIATDWSADGQSVIFKQQDVATGTWDLWAVPVQGDRVPQQITSTPYDERDGQFSPDGQSVAFESNESGPWEIYVQSFPRPGAKVRISTNGGRQVRWRRDGAELFYVALDGMLMSVPVDPAAGRAGFGTPVPLFETRLAPTLAIGRQQYVVTADGQRFLMLTAGDAPPPPITLLLNWRPPAER